MRTVGSSQPITNLGERLRVSRADLICRLHSHQHVTRDPSTFTHSHVPHFLISMDVFVVKCRMFFSIPLPCRRMIAINEIHFSSQSPINPSRFSIDLETVVTPSPWTTLSHFARIYYHFPVVQPFSSIRRTTLFSFNFFSLSVSYPVCMLKNLEIIVEKKTPFFLASLGSQFYATQI